MDLGAVVEAQTLNFLLIRYTQEKNIKLAALKYILLVGAQVNSFI